uniref:DUF676 domain-containing protein n=1 Tax=Peronospora matthiolae TaxID=2874970 RepID=A0AAV1T6F1_9STRA
MATSDSISADQDARHLPEHIVVLVHGNNGSAADLNAMETALLAKYGHQQLLLIKSRANEQDTSLGVETGGNRLAKEVVESVFEYEVSPVVRAHKLSIIGHSLGGLYARYAIVQIMKAMSCLHVAYVDFVTLCTPHLGSRRARGPSTIKNLVRLGVHKVLASRSIYGQTGVDLLLDEQEQQQVWATTDANEAQPARPLLILMSDPASDFVRSLKRFKHGTLVAMTDGDLVVPYPSASLRSHSPYVSTFLTECYLNWRWHVRHSGFAEVDGAGCVHPASAAFVERLNAKVDHSIIIENHGLGLDASCTPHYSSIEGFDCDNKQEVEFPREMLCSLQQALPWRRIDLLVEPSGVKGKIRLHDWPINKMQPPDCRADEFIDLLCDMIGADHGMCPLTTIPETAEKLDRSSASAIKYTSRQSGNEATSEQGVTDDDTDTHQSGMTSPISWSSGSLNDFPVRAEIL